MSSECKYGSLEQNRPFHSMGRYRHMHMYGKLFISGFRGWVPDILKYIRAKVMLGYPSLKLDSYLITVFSRVKIDKKYKERCKVQVPLFLNSSTVFFPVVASSSVAV